MKDEHRELLLERSPTPMEAVNSLYTGEEEDLAEAILGVETAQDLIAPRSPPTEHCTPA